MSVGVGLIRRPLDSEHERGAVLVEFALVISLFLLLVFGMIEFGLGYNDYISVRNGSREAARMGVVNDLDGAPPCTLDGTLYTPAAQPSSTADAAKSLVCKAKDRIGLDGSKVKVELVRDSDPGGTLQVCAEYPLSSITGITAPFVSGKTLVSKVSMRLEQTPNFDDYDDEGAVC